MKKEVKDGRKSLSSDGMKKENMLFAGITALIVGVTTWNVSEFLKLEKRTTTAYIAMLYNLAAILRYIEFVINFAEKKKKRMDNKE